MLGALPQDPCRWLCWIRICFSFNNQGKQIRTAHRIAPKVACGSICPFPPPPFPKRERGSDGLVIRNREHNSRGVRACKGGRSRWLGCGTMIGRKMSRRPMVMVSGAGGLQEKGGRSPPPKRGRLGGGRCAAAPYKHRLAHAPGNRPLVFRAGVPVRRGLGAAPQAYFAYFCTNKSRPPPGRRAYSSLVKDLPHRR